MRLAIITQDFPPDIGGIQTYSLEIARRISSRCEKCIVVAPAKPGDEQVDRDLPFEVFRISCRNTLLGPAAIPRMLPVFQKYGIHTTLHAQWQTLLLSVMARKAGIIKHVMVSAHGREYLFNPFGENTLPGKGYERYKRYLIGQADHFFPVSRYTSGILQGHGISPDNMDIIINGTDPELFHPADAEPLRKKYSYSGKKIILTITRLIEKKGVDTVLRAVALLIGDIPELHYIIVGKGPFEPELKKLTDELGIGRNVTFAGRVPYEKVSEYYNLSDVYVMPSELEAFGIVFLEANACGVPAIGSKVGGIGDAIVDGETGLLVEERNPRELASAIQKILEDDALREEMGRNGRRRVVEEANWENVSQKLFDSINEKS